MVFFPRAGVQVTVVVQKERDAHPVMMKPPCTVCKQLWTASNVGGKVLSLKWENLGYFGLAVVVRYVHDLCESPLMVCI